MREIAEGQQTLQVAGRRTDRIIALIALRVHELRAKLEGVFADRLTNVVAYRVSRVRMPPWHVRRIHCKPTTSIGGIGSDKIDSRHLCAKTVVKDVTHATLGKKSCWINAQRGIAMPRSRRVGNQGITKRGSPLKLGATRPVPIGQRNARVLVADHQIVQQRG